MIWLVIGFLAMLCLAGGAIYDRHYGDALMILTLGMFGALIATTVIGVVMGLLLPTHPVVAVRRPLINLSTRQGLDGRFFLGTGTVDGKPVYLYYADHGKGRIIAGTAPITSPVIEEQRDGGEAWWIEQKFTQPWMEWIGFPIGEEVEFHVPPHTVKRSLEVP